MGLKETEYLPADVLVIGGGGAGLRAAIAAREQGAGVLLVSKSPVGLGNNTAISKGAFAAATGEGDPRDNPEVHAKDTLSGGRFINNPDLVTRITGRVTGEPGFLERCGVPFEKQGMKFAIARSPGHSFARNYQGEKRLGTSFTLPLRNYAARTGVNFLERVMVTKLLVKDSTITGATGVSDKGDFIVFPVKTVILATGGIGQLYLSTNNATGTTGDGHALAFDAGVPLRDMEFVQFYPTTIAGKRLILYEVFVANLGAILRNARGENILAKYGFSDPMKVTRDRLARIVFSEVAEGNGIDGGVIMDLSPVKEENLERFRHLLPPGALAGKREFTVTPTEHFAMGGVVTDAETKTSISGLFACGEVSGGSHGANRLAANALASVFAMGGVAGENAAYLARERENPELDETELAREKARIESLTGNGEDISGLTRSLRELAWSKAGLIRSGEGLREALDKISELRSRLGRVKAKDPKSFINLLELENMLLIAEAVSRSALMREESRGAHFREDFPDESPDWKISLFIRNTGGKMTLEKMPVDAVR